MHVVLAEPAERDLVSIIDYIAQVNLAAAEKTYSTIATALRRLASVSKMGRPHSGINWGRSRNYRSGLRLSRILL